jgi:predicted regulator of Ras-like GTPase activity (Roadblock/LC7/MglB family)
MSLADSLQRVIEDLEESHGLALVGTDGIVVEERKRNDQLDLQVLGAEFNGLLKTAGKLGDSVGFGGITELVTSAERFVVIIRQVTADYFLILVIQAGGNLGKARFLLRRAAMQLATEL